MNAKDIVKLKSSLYTYENYLFDTPNWTFGMYKKKTGKVEFFKIPIELAREPSGRKIVTRKTYTDFIDGSGGIKNLTEEAFLQEIRRKKIVGVYSCNRYNRFQRKYDSIEYLF